MKANHLMKTNHLSRSLLAAIGGSILAISSASAQLFWSADATNQGGTGTWDTTTATWGTAAGGPYTTVWSNGSAANFGGTAGTVTLGEPISVTALTLTDGYEITGNTLTFTNRAINVTGTATISSNVAGSPTNGILVGAGGTLIMSDTNTFTGNFTAYQGSTVRLSGTNSNTGVNGLVGSSRFELNNAANNGGLGTGNLQFSGTTANFVSALGADHVLTNNVSLTNTGAAVFDGNFSITVGGVSTTGSGGQRTIQNDITAAGKTLTLASFTRAGALALRGDGTTIVTGNISTGTTTTFSKLDSGTLILLGDHTGNNLTISGGTYQVGDGGTTGTIATATTITNNATLAFNRSNTVEQGTDFGTVIGGSGGVTQMGSGNLILSGTNTYTGNTLVNAGTLTVTGTIASNTTVATGGTLMGSGTINGTVTIQDGGTLASGTSINSLTTGTLNLSAGSTFEYEIDRSAAPGVAGDLTAITGGLNITAGAILTISDLGLSGSWNFGDKLTLMSYSGTWDGGLFTYDSETLNNGDDFILSGAQWQFLYNDTVAGTNFTGDLTGPSYVTMTVIPEPATALLGSLGLLILLRRRRS